MPTGLTAGVGEGTVTEFREFALICARQFGACIMQRDSDPSEPPKLREVSEYAVKDVAKAEARAAELATMTLWQADKAARAEYEQRCKEHTQSEIRRTGTRNRYNAMLSAVIAWQPPTPDHQALKELMIQQLTESRQFDCDYEVSHPKPRSADKWLTEERASVKRQCDDAAQRLGEERERVAKSNAWITALYEALKPSPLQYRKDS